MTEQSVIIIGREMSPKISVENREQYRHNRREQILDAALQLFSQQGFVGTNVDDIAQKAGIAKGTLYLYFKSKDDIFNAILFERSFINHLTDLNGTDQQSIENVLTQIAENFYANSQSYVPLLRMVLSDICRFPEHAETLYRDIILKGNKIIADYLNEQVATGKIRPLEDAFLTARAFMGMMITHLLTQDLLFGSRFTEIDQKAWIRESVHLFLKGVQP
jgi:AcrR family transcriptional regulator